MGDGPGFQLFWSAALRSAGVPFVVGRGAVVEIGRAAADTDPDDLAILMYTSGTTGNPKGVMISHYNVVWTAESLLECLGWSREEAAGKRVVSYLPMAHVAERMVSHYLAFGSGFEVSTCPETGQLTYGWEVVAAPSGAGTDPA